MYDKTMGREEDMPGPIEQLCEIKRDLRMRTKMLGVIGCIRPSHSDPDGCENVRFRN